MKLEVGKSYRTRDGRKACVGGFTSTFSYPYRGDIKGELSTWKEDGAGNWHISSDEDLVEEWTDEPEQREEPMTAESKFKVGDQVFHVGDGVGKVTTIVQRVTFPV
jgi:hypothetical protein